MESLDKADKHTPKIIEFIKNFIKKIFPHISDKKVKADFEKVIEELSKFGRETKQIIESGKEIKTNSEGKNYIASLDDGRKYSTEGVDLESAKEIKRLKNENKELRRQFKETAFTVPEGNSIKKFARDVCGGIHMVRRWR